MATQNNIKYSKGVDVMLSKQEMEKRGVSSSTQIHNAIANSQCSKRNKLRICSDDMQNRMETTRERLRKKLAAKKKAKC